MIENIKAWWIKINTYERLKMPQFRESPPDRNKRRNKLRIRYALRNGGAK